MSATSRGRVSCLREVVPGVLPSSPPWQQVGVNSASLSYQKQTVDSGRLDSQALPVDTIKVGAKSAGSLSVEWKPDAFTDFLEAAFRGTFGDVIDSTGVHVISKSAKTVTLTGAFANAQVGQWALFSGFAAGESYSGAGDSPNNGWWKIAEVTSDNVVVLDDPAGMLLDETAASTSTIKSRRMLNGVRKISHAVEVAFTDAQAYMAYLGQYLNTLSMTVSAGAIVTGEFAFMGQDVRSEQCVQQYTGPVSVVGSSRTVTATGAFADAQAGQKVTLSGFSKSANNVTGTIATVVSDDAVTLTAASSLDDENAAVSYTGVVTITASSRTVEAIGAFSGMAAGRSITISGMVTGGNNVTGVVATVVSDDAVTLTSATTTLVNETGPGTAHVVSSAAVNSVSIVGAAPSWSLGGSYAAEIDTPVFNATNNVGNIYVDGEISGACFRTLNFTVNNSLRETPCIGNEFPTIEYGTPAMTGSFEKIFVDLNLWQIMRDHGSISLEFGFSNGSQGVHLSIPKVRINTDPVDLSGGNNSDVLDKVDWSAAAFTNDAGERYYAQVCIA